MESENFAAWQTELQKLRRQNNANSLPAARKPAQLCESLEATLTEQSTPLTPTAHLAALTTLLQQLAVSESEDAEELTAAALYLLAISAPYVPQAVFRAKADDLIALLGGLLPTLLNAAESAAALKSLLTTLQSLYVALGTKTKRLARPDASQLFNTLLPLLADARPKVRRKAHELVWAVVFDETLAEQHPHAERVGEHVVRTLTSAAKEARSFAGKKENNAHAATKHDEALSRLNGMCAFVKGAAKKWPNSMLPSLLAVILTLPRLQNQFLSRASYDILELLLDPHSSSAASVDTVSSALEALLALKPPQTAAVVLPGWLGALETVMVAFARIDPAGCAALVDSHLEGCLSYCASSVDSNEVRARAEKAARGLVRWCVPEDKLGGALELVGRSMKDLKWKGRGLPHLLGVLSAVVSRLRTSDKTTARSLLQPYIVDVAALRTKKHFEYREQADQVIAAAVEVGGPRWLLEVLPLNLVTPDGRVGTDGRAWLLPILRGHVTNTELGHFVTEMVPLCEALFNLKSQALSRGKGAEVEAKVFEALVDQIWALLPGYCDLPTDLSTAFTRPFAELLANVLYSQPSLRSLICRSLQVLVEKNQVLADSTAPPETMLASFGMDQNAGRHNMAHLAAIAPNMLAVLFNVFGKAGRESGGFVLDCISTYLGILSAKDLSATYAKVVDLLRKALATEGQTDKKSGKRPADAEPLATHTMINLLITLTPFADAKIASSLFSLAREQSILFNADPTVQKKAYRILGKLCDSPTGVIMANLDELTAQLTSETSPKVAAAAKRYRTELLNRLIRLLPQDQLHFVPTLLPEAVLATNEANSHTREAAFELLVLMAQKMGQGGTVKRSMLDHDDSSMTDDAQASVQEFFVMVSAGLAGSSPHMIASTITALSRLLFDFHDDLSPDALSSLLGALNDFLRVATREVVRAALGFWKVAVVCLDANALESHLSTLVNGLLTWSSDHKNHFKIKVRHIFERLIRKFGVERIENEVPEEERKFISNIRKSQQRAKRKKASARAAGEAEDGDSDDEVVKPKEGGQSAFDDALYGSESEMESDEEPSRAKGKQPARSSKQRAAFLQEDEDEPMDLLDAQVRASAPSASASRPRKAQFKLNASGKMVIDEPAHQKRAPDANADATAAYLEAIEGEDGHRRDARGRVRFNKPGQKRGRDMDVDMEDALEEPAAARPKKKVKKEKQAIGTEFKAKRAGGDVSKNGQQPYAYVPLGAVGSGRKGARNKSNFAFKAGKGHGRGTREINGTAAPAEVEATLARLASNPAVRGCLILERSKGLPIKSTGSLFDGEDSDAVQKYAQRAWQLVEATQEEVQGLEDGDSVRFLRIRTKKHELMITPDQQFILVVIQEPSGKS